MTEHLPQAAGRSPVEPDILKAIFGDGKAKADQALVIERQAATLGHVTTWARDRSRWDCSCGMYATRVHANGPVREQRREHFRAVVRDGRRAPDTPDQQPPLPR